MKKLATAACLTLLGLAAPAVAQPGPPIAELCTIEATPAATLLLPYFEVDIDDANGVDTFFSINNALHHSVLAHVIVWTDMSVEALDFNIYLTGYDVQTVGLGLIIRDGILPRTAAVNSVSPKGPYSGPHPGITLYSACASVLPYTNPVLDEEFLAHLQSILTGGPSAIYGGRCGGYDHGDNIARGYVTVDNVLDCTLLTPCDPGYFVVEPGVTGLVGFYLNALWGDWYMIDYANNFAQGDTLVHVQSALIGRPDPLGSPAPAPTPEENLADVLARASEQQAAALLPPPSFWGRCNTVFHAGRAVYDFREPLPTTWATRFYQNAAFSGGTDFLVWRDSLFNNLFGDEDGFSCSRGPGWFPLNERQVVFFDEQENPETVCTISPCPEEGILFPIEAQRVSVGDLDVVPESGWTYMNLNQLWFVGPEPVVFAAQSWVNAVHSADGRFSAGLSAIQLDSMCDLTSILLGPPPGYPVEEYAVSPFLGPLIGQPRGADDAPSNPLD